jgi:hypothetical protein
MCNFMCSLHNNQAQKSDKPVVENQTPQSTSLRQLCMFALKENSGQLDFERAQREAAAFRQEILHTPRSSCHGF